MFGSPGNSSCSRKYFQQELLVASLLPFFLGGGGGGSWDIMLSTLNCSRKVAVLVFIVWLSVPRKNTFHIPSLWSWIAE